MLVEDYEIIQFPKMRLIISSNSRLSGGKIFKKQVLIGMTFKLNTKYCFDFEDIVIGRDRNSINDPNQLRVLCSQLFAYILNNYSSLQENSTIIRELPKVLEEVIRLIKVCDFTIWHMHSYTTASAADLIYRQYLLEKGKGQLYPIHSSQDQTTINQNCLKYGLSDKFYPAQIVGCHFSANLRKSPMFYQTIVQKVQKEIIEKSKRELND